MDCHFNLPFYFTVFLGGLEVLTCRRANILPRSLRTDFWPLANSIHTAASPFLSVFGYLWTHWPHCQQPFINSETPLINSVVRKLFSFDPSHETISGLPFHSQPASAPLWNSPRKPSQKTFGSGSEKRKVFVIVWEGRVATSDALYLDVGHHFYPGDCSLLSQDTLQSCFLSEFKMRRNPILSAFGSQAQVEDSVVSYAGDLTS